MKVILRLKKSYKKSLMNLAMDKMEIKGKVYLVGAGPGDPELITVKGLELLKKAEVVLYDRLANDTLLKFCPENTELIFVGKEADRHPIPQEEIIKILIEKAKKNKTVIRLKGGDPYIFGRGSEEALALYQEGIDFEIVPGITAGIGASAYSGAPLTHRNMVTQCLFITAHESPEKNESQIEWELLAKLKNTTLVIYMGASTLKWTVEKLITLGMNPETPAIIVQNATLPSQRQFNSRLLNLPELVEKENIKPPIITIIGETAVFSDKLDWFSRKPLFGKKIVCTRAEDQSHSLTKILEQNGAIAINFSVIKTKLNKPSENLKDLLSKNFDWVIFSSENGVRYFFQLLNKENMDARALSNTKIACIGKETATRLKDFGLIADFIPSSFTSTVFIDEFLNSQNLDNQKILRVKGDFQKDYIFDSLINNGINTEPLQVYSIEKNLPDNKLKEKLMNEGADAYLFTSSSTVTNFFDVFGKNQALKLLNQSNVFAIGPVTRATLEDYQIKNIIMSETFSIEGLVNSVIQHFSKS
ncbi:MAG: uroporphyrinogen-III C-methyltransferase [Candidatus Kapabacteria bacterium]|nr:uroporphyrinogen-III C-methyltransferase [Candidatus Kapabacteria bacterium]